LPQAAKADVFKTNNDPNKDSKISVLFIIYISFSPYLFFQVLNSNQSHAHKKALADQTQLITHFSIGMFRQLFLPHSKLL
jgi:hypothetical protein